MGDSAASDCYSQTAVIEQYYDRKKHSKIVLGFS